MERIIGDPVFSAQWVLEGDSSEEQMIRCLQFVRETLFIDDYVLRNDDHSVEWIPGSHLHKLTVDEYKGTPVLRSSIAVFGDFQTAEDGSTLANNLNRHVISGTFVYDKESGIVSLEGYVALTCWWDLAIFIYALRIAIAHIENIGSAHAITRWNFCQPATLRHPTCGDRDSPHTLLRFPYPDMEELAFRGSLFISESERDEIIQLIRTDLVDCEFIEIYERKSNQRAIESLDIKYLITTSKEGDGFFNGQDVEVGYLFCEWTNFGWALTIHVALPYFTHWEAIPSGMGTMQDAIDVANALNNLSLSAPWTPLGMGTFTANRDQVNWSISIPYTCLEPVMYGFERGSISSLFGSILESNFIKRLVERLDVIAADSVYMTTRQMTEFDDVGTMVAERQKMEFVRSLVVEERDEFEVTWGFPFKPMVVFGNFDFLNSQISSIDYVTSSSSSAIMQRASTATHKSEVVISEGNLGDVSSFGEAIIEALREAGSNGFAPDFIWIPVAVSDDVRQLVRNGLEQMCAQLENHVDLSALAAAIWRYPNPWIRSVSSDMPIKFPAEFIGLSPTEQYLSMVMNPTFVDFNMGLMRAFWQGALLMDSGVDDEGTLLAVIQDWISLANDRIQKRTA